MLTFTSTTLEDLRRRQGLSAALIAAGVPERTLTRATLTAALLSLIPGLLAALTIGLIAGHALLAIDDSANQTPYLQALGLTAAIAITAILLTIAISHFFGRQARTHPTSVTPE
jgi:hypothetical protein